MYRESACTLATSYVGKPRANNTQETVPQQSELGHRSRDLDTVGRIKGARKPKLSGRPQIATCMVFRTVGSTDAC